METRRPPIIDMTPDGRFTAPPTMVNPTWPMKIAAVGLLGTVCAMALAIAAIFLWLALWLIPVAIIAGVVGWGALRFQMWKMRRSGGAARGLYRF